MITRFSVLPDERRLLLGVDLANVFEAGIVYEATNILGHITITPIGKYALPEDGKGGYPNEYSEANAIIECSEHLFTKEEQNNFPKF